MSVAFAHGLRVAFSRFVTITMTLVLLGALVLVWAKAISMLTAHIDPKPPIGQPQGGRLAEPRLHDGRSAPALPQREGPLVQPLGGPASRCLRRSPVEACEAPRRRRLEPLSLRSAARMRHSSNRRDAGTCTPYVAQQGPDRVRGGRPCRWARPRLGARRPDADRVLERAEDHRAAGCARLGRARVHLVRADEGVPHIERTVVLALGGASPDGVRRRRRLRSRTRRRRRRRNLPSIASRRRR